jgi:hypothetical protein
MNSEPERLSGSRGSLGAMLKVAREDVLSERSVEQVREGLVASGIVGSTGGVAGTGSAASTAGASSSRWVWSATKAKLSVVFGVVAVAAGAATLAHRVDSAGGAEVVTVPVRAPSPLVSPLAAQVEPSPVELAPVGEPTTAPASPQVMAPSLKAVTARTSAPPKPEATAATLQAVPPPPDPSSSPRPLPLAREGALLLEARRSLDADPRHALDLVRQHATEFPGSQLAPERDRIATEARKRMGPPP